uniref:Zinc finger protein RFP-like n=1 Tax=Chelydra serpentina TaxID=8475 RepID=A0A8C3S2K0_CHESE
MATDNPVESLQEEATCPICLEYFKDPLIIDCGHNFCRACIAQCWEGSATAASCPQCRETVQQGNLRPNRQLANMVEIAKGPSLQAAGGEKVCGEHQAALILFCEKDQTPICVICNRSRAHRAHKMVPIEEAAQEYKAIDNTINFRVCKDVLPPAHSALHGRTPGSVVMSLTSPFPVALQKQIEKERQKIVAEFQQLRQFLEEQERLLLAQLEKLDKAFVRIQNGKLTKLSEEISRLSELISELEGTCQKPASEILQSEKGKFQQPVKISPKLKVRLSDFSQKTVALMKTLRKIKGTEKGARRGNWDEPLRLGEENGSANVTLDPDTAHPQLVLSEDRKSVSLGDTCQDLPNNPERFDSWACVLGYKGFTSGRHCWEVQVGAGRHWAVGVARESVGRKGRISRSPEGGIWAVQRWGGQYEALTSAVTPLPRRQVPTRIRVCLDCDRGHVTFINAVDEAPIFTFPPGSVLGERIRPWLWVGHGSPLRLCP